MTTFTATANNSTASVSLDINRTAAVTKVVRTNVNGTEEVRASTGQIPTASGTGTLVLTDYEVTHGVNSYNVYVSENAVITNLATNPLPGALAGWTTSSGYVRTYEASRNGRPAIVVTKTGTGGWVWYGRNAGSATATSTGTPTTVNGQFPILPGQTAYVKISMGTDTPGCAGKIVIRFFDAAGVEIAGTSQTGPVVPFTTLNSWQDFSHSAVAPAGAAYFYIENAVSIDTGNTIGGEKAWGGQVFAGVINNPYFDGTTPDAAPYDYAWTGTAHASTSTLSYPIEFVSSTVTLDIDKPWLSVPVMPQYSEQVEAITQFDASRESNTTVHRPLGRADSLVVMGKLGDRTGSMEIFCNTYTDARRLERVFERGEVVQLRQRVAEMDMYFTVTSIPVSPYSVISEGATKWSMTVNYIEVRRPIGDLAGALGWTFDELAASFASFNAVTPAFTDFDALTLGDGIV